MVFTKDAQDKLVNEFFEDHTVLETQAFILGMDATIDFINKVKQEEREMTKKIIL